MNENSGGININWYPGHMAKTKKQIVEDLKLIDVVVELLDARIPISSRNPDINQYIKDKKRVVVLNKSDLADANQNKLWIEHFNKNGIPAVLTDSNSGKGISDAIKKIEQVYMEEEEKYQAKGRVGKSIRVMILGIPNVGKSSFINRISKKASAQVGNRPGVTRRKQWIRINGNIELLDTPGVLWPKFESEKVALNLAYTGTIKDDVIEIIEIGFSLLKYLIKEHLEKLVERYKLEKEKVEQILKSEQEENDKALEIMDMIGLKRGAIISGGRINQDKVAAILLEDFRSGKIGNISLETVTN